MIDQQSFVGNKFLPRHLWNMIRHLTPGQEFNTDPCTWASSGGLAGAKNFFVKHYIGVYPWTEGQVYYAYYIFSKNPSYGRYHQLVFGNGVSPYHKNLCYHNCGRSGEHRVHYDMCVKIVVGDGDGLDSCKLTIIQLRKEDKVNHKLQPLENVDIPVKQGALAGVYATLDGVYKA